MAAFTAPAAAEDADAATSPPRGDEENDEDDNGGDEDGGACCRPRCFGQTMRWSRTPCRFKYAGPKGHRGQLHFEDMCSDTPAKKDGDNDDDNDDNDDVDDSARAPSPAAMPRTRCLLLLLLLLVKREPMRRCGEHCVPCLSLHSPSKRPKGDFRAAATSAVASSNTEEGTFSKEVEVGVEAGPPPALAAALLVLSFVGGGEGSGAGWRLPASSICKGSSSRLFTCASPTNCTLDTTPPPPPEREKDDEENDDGNDDDDGDDDKDEEIDEPPNSLRKEAKAPAIPSFSFPLPPPPSSSSFSANVTASTLLLAVVGEERNRAHSLLFLLLLLLFFLFDEALPLSPLRTSSLPLPFLPCMAAAPSSSLSLPSSPAALRRMWSRHRSHFR
mmetsp:Transcript_21646/g.44438  ORF Transcript_21646/g.44438 Transcript_21646/m.44438 type:complete len:387 (+) Transcript_21646:191-1351(+)